MGEVDHHSHALVDVLEHPGVRRVELGAIVELHEVQLAIDEGHRGFFTSAVILARSGRGVPSQQRDPECHRHEHDVIAPHPRFVLSVELRAPGYDP